MAGSGSRSPTRTAGARAATSPCAPWPTPNASNSARMPRNVRRQRPLPPSRHAIMTGIKTLSRSRGRRYETDPGVAHQCCRHLPAALHPGRRAHQGFRHRHAGRAGHRPAQHLHPARAVRAHASGQRADAGTLHAGAQRPDVLGHVPPGGQLHHHFISLVLLGEQQRTN